MTFFRRAEYRASFTSKVSTVSVLAGITLALGACLTIVGLIAAVARRLVVPSDRKKDTTIVDLDTRAQTITLRRTPDTVLPGRYGLFTTGTESYIKVGAVLSEDDTTVTRKLLTQIDATAHLSAEAAFSGWYYDSPEELYLPFSREQVTTPVGRCPAWLFPVESDTGIWCIHIHGRGAQRAECLRAVPIFSDLGITSLVVSYRNDGEAPRSRDGSYRLGAEEWRDVDAAVTFAREHGARRILVMGWSMGGAIALQLELNSLYRDEIIGVILESPVVEWRSVVNYNADLMRIPRAITGASYKTLQSSWVSPLGGVDEPIPLERLDMVANAAALTHPILILHSDDDGFVPSQGSHRLAAVRPDLVQFEVFRHARHTKLWNYDQDRWTEAIRQWVDRCVTIAVENGDS